MNRRCGGGYRWACCGLCCGNRCASAILDYFGVKRDHPVWGLRMPLNRKWKLAVMLLLVTASLCMSGYAAYRAYRPKVVERVVENTKLVPQYCPKVDSGQEQSKPRTTSQFAAPKTPPQPSQSATGNNNGQVGGGVTTGPCSNVQGAAVIRPALIACLPKDTSPTPKKMRLERWLIHCRKIVTFCISNGLMSRKPRYGNEISQYFANKTTHIGTVLSWGRNSPPEGVRVVVDGEKDPLFPVAQKIADAFSGSGIPVNFTNFTNPKPGTVYIVIGTAPRPKQQ